MLAKSKSYSDTPKPYSAHKTEATHNILRLPTIILPLLTIILLTSLSILPASALTYQDNVELQFTWNPTIRISLSSADLVINNLTPGNSADSNTITINVGTNNMYGYTLSATAGNTTNASTNLVNTVDDTKLFTSLATDASLASLTTDNTWGYSFSTNSGTSWSNYSGLPLYTAAAGAELVNNDGSGSTPVQFKIAAKASTIQASGAYTNTINFTAVANPEPTPQPITCDAGKICYSENALDSEGTMDAQTASSNTDTMLLAPNYARAGYGFAGWSPNMDGTGTKYGPNEVITTGDLTTNGLALYATWVPSAGNLQNWTGCSSLASGAVTALTDSRDNNTYAVAKLADGKCWMIENLRLDPAGMTLNSTNTNNPTSDFASQISNLNASSFDPSCSGNGWFSPDSQCLVEPSIGLGNVTGSTSSPTSSSQSSRWYSYGTMYTWYTATAGNGIDASNDDGVADGDICPTGWNLPRSDTVNDYYNLAYAVNGNNQFYTDAASKAMRSYPTNFVYSGFYNGTTSYSRGFTGVYTSSSIDDDVGWTSGFIIEDGVVNVYADSNATWFLEPESGLAVRCIAQ